MASIKLPLLATGEIARLLALTLVPSAATLAMNATHVC